MHDVADHRAGRRGDHADHLGQEGQRFLVRRVEQAFGGERLAALLQHRHEGAEAGELDLLDHDLVARRAGIGGEAAGADDFEPGLRLDLQPLRRAAPYDGVEDGLVVLQVEIDMAGGVEFQSGNLAAHAHEGEGILHRALERRGNLADGIFRQVGEGLGGGLGHESEHTLRRLVMPSRGAADRTERHSGSHGRSKASSGRDVYTIVPTSHRSSRSAHHDVDIGFAARPPRHGHLGRGREVEAPRTGQEFAAAPSVRRTLAIVPEEPNRS